MLPGSCPILFRQVLRTQAVALHTGPGSPPPVRESLRCPEVAPVKVRLLGPRGSSTMGSRSPSTPRKAIALLAHLALSKGPRPRDVLAELLWPGHDTEHARGALRRTLSALRGAVGAGAVDATRDRVALVRGPGLERSGRDRRRGSRPARISSSVQAHLHPRASLTPAGSHPFGGSANRHREIARAFAPCGECAKARAPPAARSGRRAGAQVETHALRRRP